MLMKYSKYIYALNQKPQAYEYHELKVKHTTLIPYRQFNALQFHLRQQKVNKQNQRIKKYLIFIMKP